MWIRTSLGSVPVCSGRQVWLDELRNSVFQVIGDFENQSRSTLPPEANMYLKLLELETIYPKYQKHREGQKPPDCCAISYHTVISTLNMGRRFLG
jgi:hypothetical protein